MTQLDEVRRELRAWGRFWCAREAPMGYPRQSGDAKLADTLATGIWSSSTKWQDTSADTIPVPAWVERIDEAVGQLEPRRRAALRARYVSTERNPERRMSQFARSLRRAEIDLVGLL